MAEIKASLFVFLFLCLAIPAHAATLRTNDFAQWLYEVEQEALAAGISPVTVEGALGHVMPDERVVELDQRQPETTVTFESYSRRILSQDRIERGQQLLDQYGALLDTISAKYGVPPQVIVALWGMESSFGRMSGDYNVIDSLATLAYEGRRAAFFRKELLDALRILDQEHLPATELRGSWAGAMGQCQFMPSTYLRYAVDYDNNGFADIWSNPSDVFASIANYLASEGWNADLTWGREVETPDDLSASEAGLSHTRLLSEWRDLGVRNLDGSSLPDKPLQASLVQPDGPDGRSFLVYDNFRTLMRWNRSTYFASAVGLLADRIK